MKTLRLSCLRGRGGFTLIEVAVAATISFMAITAVVSVFIAASKMTVESYYRNQASMQARTVIDHLTGDVRTAISLENTYGSFTAGSNTLILKVPAINSSGYPVDINSKFDYIIYYQDSANDNILKRKVVADASSSRASEDRKVGSSESTEVTLQGTYDVLPDALGAFVIYYKFTAEQKYGSKTYDMPVAGSVRLRNRTPA